jgi:hypothetical protein
VSCLAEQAKLLFAEAEENNLDWGAKNPRWNRWHTCSLCEQEYHGVVRCALGWACWKTYLGRPETDQIRLMAMSQLGNGLSQANQNEDALSVKEAEMAMLRRLGVPEGEMLNVQCNLAITYASLGRFEHASLMQRDVYSGRLQLLGEQHEETLIAACNYANSLYDLQRFGEAKAFMRRTLPVARRVLGESDALMLRMRWGYAYALYKDPTATLDDVREAMTTLEDAGRIARRVLGSAHPVAKNMEGSLRAARAALAARERQDPVKYRDPT